MQLRVTSYELQVEAQYFAALHEICILKSEIPVALFPCLLVNSRKHPNVCVKSS